MKKKPTKQQEDIIKILHGIPSRVQVLGFYNGVPILHDPKYPTPDGVIYFLNGDFINEEMDFARKKRNKTILKSTRSKMRGGDKIITD